MSVVLKASDNTIIVNGKVVATAKPVYVRDTVGTTNNLTSEPSVLNTDSEIVSISAGYNHTIYLSNSGKVYASGYGRWGVLGLGDTNNQLTPVLITYFNTIPIKAISAGGSQTIFLSSTGVVYSTGRNEYGALGLGKSGYTDNLTPEQITYFTDNSIIISAISTGNNHTIFLSNTGNVYVTGRILNPNQSGFATDILTPEPIAYFNTIPIKSISAGDLYTIFLGTNNIVYCYGYGQLGQLGSGGSSNKYSPEPITYFTNNSITINSISAGRDHTLFLDTAGKLYVTGFGERLAMGVGASSVIYTPVPIGYFSNVRILAMSAGQYHSTFVDTTGKVYAVGYNDGGQLGFGDKVSREVPEIITYFNNIPIASISAGLHHTIFLGTDGKVYTTGTSTNPNLGLGNIGKKNSPETITFFNFTPVAVNATTGTGGNINHNLFTLSTVGYYRISFPIYTIVNINSGEDLGLKGNYNIIIGTTSSVIPTIDNSSTTIPFNPTTISSIVIRYHLILPFVVNLQWTYNAENANVYYPSGGNVGIGITNPTNALHVAGNTFSTTYSASSKTFKIEHPLKLNKWLYHGCIEGPRFDNIYRGKKLIINGKADVDIDAECNTTGGMTSGTFPALNTNVQLFLRNNETYDRVKGTINGSIITIECENTTDEIEIDWLVIGERHDEHVINTELTDSEGNLVCEHDMPQSTEADPENIPVTNVDITGTSNT